MARPQPVPCLGVRAWGQLGIAQRTRAGSFGAVHDRSAILDASPIVASFHLARVEPAGAVMGALRHMATDRVLMRRVPGLRFARSLGCGDGRTFTPRGADLHRWARFCVWDHPDALLAFEASHPVARQWAELAAEQWRAELEPLRHHGQWGGTDPFSGQVRATHVETRVDGADAGLGIAVVTRARVKVRHWRRFWAAAPPVATELERTEGLRYTVGIGEAPVGLQATFSLWRSADDVDRFAYRSAAHLRAMHDTQSIGWYAEAMFARFRVVSMIGTVDGRVP